MGFIDWFREDSGIISIDDCFSSGYRVLCQTTSSTNELTDPSPILVFEFSMDKLINYVWIFTHDGESGDQLIEFEEYYPPPIEIQYWKYVIPFTSILVLIAWSRRSDK